MSEVIAVRTPNENVNDETVTVLRWLVTDGQSVLAEQPLVEIETSKTTFEVPAPVAGVVKLLVCAATEVPIGALLCYVGPSVAAIETEAAKTPLAVPAPPPVSSAPAHVVHMAPALSAPSAPATDGTTRLSPAAAALIQDRGLDPKVFAGRGLIRTADVLAHLGEGPAPTPASAPVVVPRARSSGPVPATGVATTAERIPRSKLMEIKYLSSGQAHTLPSVVSVQVPTQGLQALKQRDPNTAGLLSAATIFETARLLRKYRQFNAFYADHQVHYYQGVHIGFAIDMDQGLKVPVVHDADTKSIPEILACQRELLVAYMENTLLPAALAGGTFTITDLSSEGVCSFLPLINQGQSAILGVTAEVLTGPASGYYQLILAFDHQVAEGRAAARFLSELGGRLVAYELSLQAAARAQMPPAEPCCYRCQTPLSELPRGHHMLQAMVPGRSDPQPLCTICIEDY